MKIECMQKHNPASLCAYTIHTTELISHQTELKVIMLKKDLACLTSIQNESKPLLSNPLNMNRDSMNTLTGLLL